MDSFFVNVLGRTGVTIFVGILIFLYVYKNSIKLFAWIEDQTFGTRDFILSKCELLFVQMNPDHITIGLVVISIGIPLIIFGVFAVFGKYFIGAVMAAIFAVVGWKTPRPLMNVLVAMRIKRYQVQMTDALTLLSNGLRAGLSLQQSIGMVVNEMPNPISQEFNLILQQNKIGVTLEECFENLNKRVNTEDNEMFVTSVNILKETGGNLAETFDTIASVIRERVRLTQKIDTYIAQGKFQGGLICMMPFLMAFMFGSSDPESMLPLVTTPLGIIISIVICGLDFTGAFIMWKLIQIKV
jgi:tight adherence protein B